MGLLTSKSKMNTLLHSAGNGDEVVVKRLICDGIYLNGENRYGNQAIHLATKYGRKKVVELLLDYGDVSVNTRGYLKQTPLHYAVRYGHLAIIESLVTRNAKCNKRDSGGDTPLHIALKYFTKKCCYQSLRNECKNQSKLTDCKEIRQIYEVLPLFIKEKCVYLAIAIYLMKNGTANIAVKNEEGLSAIKCLPSELIEPFLMFFVTYYKLADRI